MQIGITVTEVGKPSWIVKGKNKYQELVLKFEGDKGPQQRKFVSFGDNKTIFDAVQQLKEGASYSVEIIKEGDFWNWKSITESGTKDSEKPSTTRTTSSSSNWDARLAFDREKQPLIIRQSCIGYAVEFFKCQNENEASPEITDVLSVASVFERFVNTGEVFPQEAESDVEPDAPTAETTPRRRRAAEAVD